MECRNSSYELNLPSYWVIRRPRQLNPDIVSIPRDILPIPLDAQTLYNFYVRTGHILEKDVLDYLAIILQDYYSSGWGIRSNTEL